MRIASVLVVLTACGTQAQNEHADVAPARYAGTCAFAGIEEVPAPAGQREDTVTMVARYRFGSDTSRAAKSWSVRFEVARARTQDLQLQLAAHPTIICNPDSGPTIEDLHVGSPVATAPDEEPPQ